MILSDSEIKKLLLTKQLIRDYEEERAQYCGYELRLGKVFLPESGEVQWVDSEHQDNIPRFPQWLDRWISARGLSSASKGWTIGPSEMLIVETRETVNIPDNLCATYGQLNRLARQGLMLVNASIVEPGYDGPLSCVLVNFSSQRITVFPDQPIAKIYFYTIKGTPDSFQQAVPRPRYEEELSTNAMKFPKSFLDITGVEERVTQKMRSVIRRGVAFSGIVIVMLLLWSQLEPLFTNWLWERTGVMSSTKQGELKVEQLRLETQRTILEFEAENYYLVRRVDELEREIRNLKEEK